MKKLIIIAGFLALTACSTMPQNTLLTNVALSAATSKYIQAGDTVVRAARILKHIAALRTSFNTDGSVDTTSTLMAAINKRIDWNALLPEDQILATVILQLIEDNLPPTTSISVEVLNQVFDLIQQVALRY